MNRHRASIAICLLWILCLATVNGQTSDTAWPNWRGPLYTGMAAKGNPPISWGKSENIKWKVPVPGASQSSPVVWGTKLFYLTAVDTGKAADGSTSDKATGTVLQFKVICLDRSTGKELWQQTAVEAVPHEPHHPTATFASYSPVTDGDYVWASFGSRGLYCYDVNGNLKWSRPLVQMSKRGTFGEGSSPCLAGEAVIAVCDHEGQSKLFAFNKETGDVLWEANRDEGSNWTTPVPVEVDGKMQVVISGSNFTRAYDVRSGDEVWRCSGQTANAIPTPVPGFGKIFCISGFRGSALQAITLGKTGDLSDTDAVAWELSDATPYVPSPVLDGHRLFFIASSSNKGVVSCVDVRTGKFLFTKQALPDMNTVYSSFVGVADRVYVSDRSGHTVVLENSDTFKVLASNQLDDGFNATPAIVGDELYLKGDKFIYCIARE